MWKGMVNELKESFPKTEAAIFHKQAQLCSAPNKVTEKITGLLLKNVNY